MNDDTGWLYEDKVRKEVTARVYEPAFDGDLALVEPAPVANALIEVAVALREMPIGT